MSVAKPLNTTVRISGEWNKLGAPADPSPLTLRRVAPNGTTVTDTYGGRRHPPHQRGALLPRRLRRPADAWAFTWTAGGFENGIFTLEVLVYDPANPTGGGPPVHYPAPESTGFNVS